MRITDIKHRLFIVHNLEIVVIGGEQFGESILIHFPDNKWVIIDSCVSNLYPDKPLPQLYLEMRGFNDRDDVTHIICTHWHLDHIKGLPSLLEYYRTAIFVFPFMNNEYIDYMYQQYISSLTVIGKNIPQQIALIYDACMNLITKYRITKEMVKVRDRIKHYWYGGVEYQLFSLSPSDLDLENFLNNIRQNQMDTRHDTPNKTSLALLLQVGQDAFVFGGDLLINLDNNLFPRDRVDQVHYVRQECNNTCGGRVQTGWCGVVGSGMLNQTRLRYIKMAHHGSANGFCQEIFNYASKKPIGVVTCFGSQSLPDARVLDEISDNYKKIYVTNCLKDVNTQYAQGSVAYQISLISQNLQTSHDIGVVVTRMFCRHCLTTSCYGNAIKLNI